MHLKDTEKEMKENVARFVVSAKRFKHTFDFNETLKTMSRIRAKEEHFFLLFTLL